MVEYQVPAPPLIKPSDLVQETTLLSPSVFTCQVVTTQPLPSLRLAL